MKYCSNCGSPVQDEQKYCPNCGSLLQSTVCNNTSTNSASKTIPVDQAQADTTKNSATIQLTDNKRKSKPSALSIVAFILSFTLFLSPIAVILSIIDLAKNKQRKHGLSIAALIIGGVLTAVLILSRFGAGQNSTTTIDSRASVTDNQKDSEKKQDTDKTPKATEKPTPTSKVNTKEDFISSCSSVVYQDVERSPDSYKGKNVCIEGTVIQVTEGWFDSVIYRVATDSHGNADIWYVTYTRSSDEERILEDDHVVIYGVCDGVETYKTVLGASVTIPALKAKYIEVAKRSEAQFTMSIVKFDIAKESYGNNFEYYAIVEIANHSDGSIYISDASFDLEDNTGHLIQTNDFEVSIYRTIIKPGEIGYLYNTYAIDIKNTTDYENLVLKPQFKAQSTHVVLTEYEVLDTSLSNGTFGISVTGRIRNNTNKDDSYVYVRVVYYDEDGKALGISGSSVTGLDAGKTVSFEISGISMNSDFSINDVANYEVLAEESYYGF